MRCIMPVGSQADTMPKVTCGSKNVALSPQMMTSLSFSQ